MSDSHLQEEKETILKRPFDGFFLRSNATEGKSAAMSSGSAALIDV
jgi:hypothetical protein